ncbi:MAG: methyltransferase protein [Flavipsychrobacter sp.]|jgi:SAM-dependent methyltransferase|nr:methyltransferase protein [Flavipsychrobacter sp.]
MPQRFQHTNIINSFHTDERFNDQYPPSISALAGQHWTPLSVARRASQFLATGSKVRILDIGSGVGKFCLAAAHFEPSALFYGVEQRKRLVHYADKAKEALGLENVFFIHANFTQIDFRNYDHFYFYNSFYENLDGTDKIDENIEYSGELFNYYNRYLYRQLDQRPPGTRLVTYHSQEDEIPANYHLADSMMDSLLKFWIKA